MKPSSESAMGWPSRVSILGPDLLRYHQGVRDICEECCKPFRRLSAKTICGACAPAPTTSLSHCIINPWPEEEIL